MFKVHRSTKQIVSGGEGSNSLSLAWGVKGDNVMLIETCVRIKKIKKLNKKISNAFNKYFLFFPLKDHKAKYEERKKEKAFRVLVKSY